MTAIDLTDQLDAIRDKYPDWWRKDVAFDELQALWGGTPCNDCGVFNEQEKIDIDLPSDSRWRGTIKITRALNGWYAVATSYKYALGGGTSPISVWNCTAYTTRDEAIEAAALELKRSFEGIRDSKGYAPDSQRETAQRMIEQIETFMRQSRQMTLF